MTASPLKDVQVSQRSSSSQSTPHSQFSQVLSMTTPATRVSKKNGETGLSTVNENINCHSVAAPKTTRAPRQRTTTVRL